MSFGAYLHRAAKSLRARFSLPDSREVSVLAKEMVLLREEIARLRATQASSAAYGLNDRLGQLEIILTEHSKSDSRGLTKSSFPSPVVSIVMPAWNRAKVISDAIGSVQAQHFADWELLIIDDGSIDNTSEIVATFADDRRIRYVKQAHAGASQARNHGLRLAQGSLIAYLDSDNLWYPGFMAAAVAAFAADPATDSAYGALITEAHGKDQRILFRPFDRAELVKENFIDLNTFVHRRSLVEACGEFDETLDRLIDWDLILRYTQHAPARRLPVLAARYRALDEHRITNSNACGVNYLRVRRKWRKTPSLTRPLRVLYLLWHYPQLSETYIESEILCMKRWGVHIEAWSRCTVATPYEPSVPVHRGSIAEAIAACRPDILHVHWTNIAIEEGEQLLASGLPFTVRGHGFEFTDKALQKLLTLPGLRRAFVFPHQIGSFSDEPRLTPMAAAFDTSLFRPEPNKDRQLVIRTGAALASKDLELFFDVARRLPNFRFVMAAVDCLNQKPYMEELIKTWKSSNSGAELMLNVPRDQLAPLVHRAGFYLHTMTPPNQPGGTPIGMPISIAEAMATGAYVLVRDVPPLNSYFGRVGSVYRNAKQAAELIAETAAWPEAKWKQAWTKSVDHAFMKQADEIVLQPLFDEWCAIGVFGRE
jgi:glycosyltransferase involved in cell wall biosynthesis